ncbi:MAG: hypothetical protein PHE03_05415 [Bacteroidales bacterium]|nr:hypothetical protein [Bacteroidales bacterium]
MIKKKLLVIIGLSILLLSCKKEKKVEVFSADKPFSIEVKRERSYYQAEKIAERLKDKGLEAFVINSVDSVEGNWFSVMSGALSHPDSVDSYIDMVEKLFRLSNLKVKDYNSIDSFTIITTIDTTVIKETRRIAAKEPAIPKEVFDVVKSFPMSNALYLQSINIGYFPSDEKGKKKSLDILNRVKHDLPRGVSFAKLAKDGISFSEAVFQDNLYGDRVTIQSIKLKPKTQVSEASFFPTSATSSAYELAAVYADLILNTGSYTFEEKTKVEVNSAIPLLGYKVVIETRKDVFRTYFVMVDINENYLFFSQSTNKTDEEMVKILSAIGRSDGLIEYDEFYNTFYILPSQAIEEEIFLGFSFDKIAWDYAKSRGYAKWSVEMVGHWVASAYFFNPTHGVWNFSIFDMISKYRQDYVYGRLYSSAFSKDKDRIDVYGVSGHLIYDQEYDRYSYTMYRSLTELNFAQGRYICAIGNRMAYFNEPDLVARANSLQFAMGGYLADKN